MRLWFIFNTFAGLFLILFIQFFFLAAAVNNNCFLLHASLFSDGIYKGVYAGDAEETILSADLAGRETFQEIN